MSVAMATADLAIAWILLRFFFFKKEPPCFLLLFVLIINRISNEVASGINDAFGESGCHSCHS